MIPLPILCRVCTQAHIAVTAESIIELFNNRKRVVGLKFDYEPV